MILATDKILWESVSVTHAYGLIVFVVIDFVTAALLQTKPSKTALTAAASWSILRILLQVADVYLAPSVGYTGPTAYSDFAYYLFSPTATNCLTEQVCNPTGVPGALIDLIIILQLIVIAVTLTARSATKK